MKLPVLNRSGCAVFRVHDAEAVRLLTLGQAVYSLDGRTLRLLDPAPADQALAGRTHTSRGGLLAAIGRSQQYTTAARGRVDGFKRIFAEDRSIFQAAVLDCMGRA